MVTRIPQSFIEHSELLHFPGHVTVGAPFDATIALGIPIGRVDQSAQRYAWRAAARAPRGPLFEMFYVALYRVEHAGHAPGVEGALILKWAIIDCGPCHSS